MTNSLIGYREAPLTLDAFDKLHSLAEEKLDFKKKYVRKILVGVDEYGERAEKTDYVESGIEIFSKGHEIPEKLIQSLRRPAKKEHISVHLVRLELHKRYARGKQAWAIVMNDLCGDMADLSEYAIIRACEDFRKSTENNFFPDTGKLQARARDYDFAIRNLDAPKKENKSKQETPEVLIKKTTKSKRRVALLVKLATMKRKKTKWEERWMRAYMASGGSDKVYIAGGDYDFS